MRLPTQTELVELLWTKFPPECFNAQSHAVGDILGYCMLSPDGTGSETSQTTRVSQIEAWFEDRLDAAIPPGIIFSVKHREETMQRQHLSTGVILSSRSLSVFLVLLGHGRPRRICVRRPRRICVS